MPAELTQFGHALIFVTFLISGLLLLADGINERLTK
jgi:hypothetical protein